MDIMSYKGYLGTVEYSAEDHCMYGKLAFIRDLVNYEAATVPELEIEFKTSVDAYLLSCKELNREPSKPYNISVSQECLEGGLYYVARIQELPGVMEFGDTHEEAYELALDTLKTAYEMFSDQGMAFPEPQNNKTSPFNPFDYIKTQDDINTFLCDCLADEDPNTFTTALGHLIKK
ncbi:hypothetical protein HPX47_001652 [Vibrio alginolyticus]|nr:hypothetical protein [Vibrio alginolyticus]